MEKNIEEYIANLTKVVQSFGMSAYDAGQALHKVSLALANSQKNMSDLVNLKHRIDDAEFAASNIESRVGNLEYNYATKGDVYVLEDRIDRERKEIDNQRNSNITFIMNELNDLRSEMVARTEKPKQKGDLEILNQIEWDEEFLKIMNEPIVVDF